ncbi:type II secretion system F family protein [Acinetobacter baumannii]|uniref:type II secretion system F family protein n=1 Tax=Acinetobacter baumannii TaxID=470 RepID=UPI002341B518|nr:type II secretion system F family protein [Acinetobacter baumannii]MDC4953639.1 type II secretion system F family protein [Acinetobacter baumannii]MDH2532422.1 type II secretion system F family protein [Acinetobacter baumannii]MDV7611324.1 type II secretion system F family protein [Acinetobacter baumannii]
MYIYLILIAAVIVALTYYLIVSESLSNIFLKKTNKLEEQLNLSYVFLNLKKILFIYFILLFLILGSVLLIFQFSVIYIFAVIFFLILPFLLIKKFKKIQIEKMDQQLPDALMLISGGLKSGASLSTALFQLTHECLPPLKNEIALIIKEQKVGLPLNEALFNFQQRMPINSVVLMTTSIRIALETGGELAETLTKAAETLRQINQSEGKIKALTAQGKMQAWVVGLMPIALILVLNQMEPEAMDKLWSTPAGWIALTGIALFEVMGMIFIRKIVNIDV